MSSKTFEDAIRAAQAAPTSGAKVEFLMNRPAEGKHVRVDELYLDVTDGIHGDRWKDTAWLRLSDGSPDPRVQISLTNAGVMRCFTRGHPEGVYACGDNIYTDLSLTVERLRMGTRLQLGEAVIEISDVENDACGKFAQRFGVDAFNCVRDDRYREFRLRGLFARVVISGLVKCGDQIVYV